MTREEIFESAQGKPNYYLLPTKWELEAMEQYKDQELSELQAKYDKLKYAFEELLDDHLMFVEGERGRNAKEDKRFREECLQRAGLTPINKQ